MKNNLDRLLEYLLEEETAKSRHLFENGVGGGEIIEENVNEAMETEPPEGSHIEINGSERVINIEIVKDVSEVRGDRLKKRENYITISQTGVIGKEDKNVWEVNGVRAEHGYGPMLYDIAMEMLYLIGGAGLMPDRSPVSKDAQAVWKRYYEDRSDVDKNPLPQDMFVDDEHRLVRNRPEYIRYYYSKRGAPLLNSLKAAGLVQPGRMDLIDTMSYLD